MSSLEKVALSKNLFCNSLIIRGDFKEKSQISIFYSKLIDSSCSWPETIKQLWLAERMGKTYMDVSHCNMNKAQPSVVHLVEIANAQKVDAKDLIETTLQK